MHIVPLSCMLIVFILKGNCDLLCQDEQHCNDCVWHETRDQITFKKHHCYKTCAVSVNYRHLQIIQATKWFLQNRDTVCSRLL